MYAYTQFSNGIHLNMYPAVWLIFERSFLLCSFTPHQIEM